MPGEPLISFDNVGKVFYLRGRRARGVEALRAMTFAVAAGECVGVVGPNGAGKSTLFGMLLGFIRPTSGQVRVGGAPPRDYLRARGAGYLPERFQLPAEWGVRDTLTALGRLGGIGADNEARVEQSIERFGLGDHATKPIGALSRGLLQRLGLAQALLGNHELVVLDEPTEGLDPLWRVRLREIIADLRAAGRTVLLASHELGEVELMVDRVLVLDRGGLRDQLQVVRADAARTYRVVLQEPHDAVQQVFAGARTIEPRVYLVDVANPADLSSRLAALLAAGAVLESATPAERLEDRVRQSLAGGASTG